MQVNEQQNTQTYSGLKRYYLILVSRASAEREQGASQDFRWISQLFAHQLQKLTKAFDEDNVLALVTLYLKTGSPWARGISRSANHDYLGCYRRPINPVKPSIPAH